MLMGAIVSSFGVTFTQDSFPYAGRSPGIGPPTWPMPGDLPAYGNESWVNVTPNELTIAPINMSVGDYVAGNVTVSSGTIPNDFTVTPVSIDNPSYASYAYSESQ